MEKVDIKLMQILSESEEYDIFDTEAIQTYIKFKWDKVGRNHHAFGALVHLLYLIYLARYVNHVYIDAALQNGPGQPPKDNDESMYFLIGIAYPTLYELAQCY